MGRRTRQESNGTSQNSLCLNLSNQQKELSISLREARKALKALLAFFEIECEELSLFFVTEKKICDLHLQFFNDPSPTDCISLPLDSSYLGDLFVCPKTALLYAKKHNLDPYEETLLYVVHSFLHLIGYDDLEPKKKRVMRKMEKKCMDHLKSLGIRLEAKVGSKQPAH